MSELFGVFRQHLLWSLLLWVVVFIGFAALFARGRLSALGKGLFKLVLSVVISPFVFLRRATSGVLGFDADQEESDRGRDPYLLIKTMRVLQAVIIIASIGALAAGVVATWNVLVPPKEVRQAAREYRPEVEKQRDAASKAASVVAKLDSEWAAKKAGVVARFRNQRSAAISQASRDMGYIDSSITQYGNEHAKQVVERLRERAVSGGTPSLQSLEYTKRAMDSIVYNASYWLEEWSRNSLNRWTELWLTRTTAEVELRELSESALRAVEQPEHEAAAATSAREGEVLQSMIERQAQLDEAASLKWKRAGLRAVSAFVAFLLFVWMAGLLVESGWLILGVAGDVRRLRESADAPRTQGLLETTQRDALLPIRDSAGPRAARP